MQKRAEEKANAAREEKKRKYIGLALVLVLACVVISFPVRRWSALNGTYIEVAGEKITRVEFDYYYQSALASYLSQNGMFLGYMGIDTSNPNWTDTEYSEGITFEDLLEEVAVTSIIQNMAAEAEAREKGFEYDVESDYSNFVAGAEAGAKEQGVSVNDFIAVSYGSYATLERIEEYVKQDIFAAAYLNSVSKELLPSVEDASAHYAENKDEYDSVDYRMTLVEAELPKAPAGAEGSTDESAPYTPTEAEIEAAMKIAKDKADKLLDTIATSGELVTGGRKAEVSNTIREWLFASERKAGDKIVLEDKTLDSYYVLSFEKRYLDESVAADLRAIVVEIPEEDDTTKTTAQDILDEWKKGEQTEENFAVLADKYNDPNVFGFEGGLMTNADTRQMLPELGEWIKDSKRVAGDTVVIEPEDDTYAYLMYFVKHGEKAWVLEIQNELLQEKVADYLEEMVKGYEVTDDKGRLDYLEVRAKEEASSEAE
jgi:hypothetical protein